MKLNAKKCNVLKLNSKSKASLMVENSEAEEVDSFLYYLGANVTKDSKSMDDTRKRIVLHGCETWKLTKTEEKRIDTFQTKSLKRMSDQQING